MSGGANPAWAVAFLVAGHQRELRDYDDVTPSLKDTDVHHAVIIVKDTQTDNLLHQPVYVFLGVGFFYTQQDEITLTDLRLYHAANCY